MYPALFPGNFLSMPKILGDAARVVDDGHGLTIDELAGNVATKEDTISIAMVKIAAPTAEPWLTLAYDEWMCVLKGRVVLKFDDGKSELEVKGGQTVFIAKGERFKPEFPDAGTEYIPVAIPAFRPDRCIREDGPNSDVSQKLAALHGLPSMDLGANLRAVLPKLLLVGCGFALSLGVQLARRKLGGARG